MRLFAGAHVLTSRPAVARVLASKLPQRRLRFYVGHAGWGPGQLDGEILRGDWHVMAAAIDVVFGDAADDVWERLIARAEGLWTRPRSRSMRVSAAMADHRGAARRRIGD
jgi:putative AlgH/UPF0301 family transcriptional regulator